MLKLDRRSKKVRHILLENARRYRKPQADVPPDGYVFLDREGYWADSVTGEALMRSDNPRFPCTKKADIETGEDQKR